MSFALEECSKDSSQVNENHRHQQQQQHHHHHSTNNYSFKYRLIKTLLLIFAFISFGMIQELARITLEDLKILLNTNYADVLLVMIYKNVGYLVTTCFFGIVMDYFLHAHDACISFGNVLMVVATLLVPWSQIYWLTSCLYFIQGIGTAIYDIGTNYLIMNLWKDISNSPINAMHAGYGVGGIIALQLLTPYLKFKPLRPEEEATATSAAGGNNITNITLNSTQVIITSSDIKLQIPFIIASVLASVFTILFIISQYYEYAHNKHIKKLSNKHIVSSIKYSPSSLNGETGQLTVNETPCQKQTFYPALQKIFFKNVVYQGSAIYIIMAQIVLLYLLFMAIVGFITVPNFFMLSYLTKGPAKFTLQQFTTLTTVFWLCFIIGRFIATFVAFKISSIKFYFLLLLFTFIPLCLYIVPYFNKHHLSTWIITCVIGITSGPMVPSTFMLANSILKNMNSFIVSLFCIASCLGAIITQYLTGYLLDKHIPNVNLFKYFYGLNEQITSIYIIPYLMFAFILLSFSIFLLIFIVNKNFKHILKINSKIIS